MAHSTTVLASLPRLALRLGASIQALTRERMFLAAILLGSAGLNLIGINRNGLGNTYYAVTVHSMLQSWHNWFFASFDPGGFVTVDKPPLGFWIQSASVRIFGFNGIALILPQAIAGVVSVWLLYRIVSKHFSETAALISAFVFAITPISVVTNRSNVLDSLLVLFVLAATYATIQAMQRGSLRWLLLTGMLVGLAFNVKMLEAYLVVPALGAAYLLTAPIPWRTRLWHLVAAAGVLIGVSLAWITVVDFIAAAHRPYIGSSYHNSELDLVWLYNGLQRFNGTPFTKPFQASDPRGLPGPLRLIIPQLAGQSGWFLLLALPMLTLAFRRLGRLPGQSLSHHQGALLLWGLWLAPMLIFFSMARFFNVYYLVLLSPAVAALVGIGVVHCWTEEKAGRWEGWVLVGGTIATAVEQGIILTKVSYWNPWLTALIGLLLGIFVLAWLSMRFLHNAQIPTSLVLQGIAVVALAGIVFLAPLLWTLSSLHPDIQAGFPRSGPSRTAIPTAENPQVPAPLIAYLRQHAAATTFLVATVDAPSAIPLILATGAPVMAMGGYTGFDPILTPSTLAQRIANRTVQFFYLPASNLTVEQMQRFYPHARPIAPHFTNALTQWVAQQCRALPPADWGVMHATTTTTIGPMQLFDCGT